MAIYSRNHDEKGFLIIDVLIGLFVASIITVAFLASVVSAVRFANTQTKEVQAELLAIELLEVARELETSDWLELSSGLCAAPGIPCHPEIVANAWHLESGEEVVGSFVRSSVIEPVYRDASHNITTSGTIDPLTKKVIARVSWSAYGTTRELTLETYVYENL